MIEKYFEKLNEKKVEMETAYKNYLEHIELKCSICGISYKEFVVSGSTVPKGLDSKLIDDEEYANEYKKKYKEYKVEREKCLKDINKLDSSIHRLIIEYTYINHESNKEICNTLRMYHKMDYSESYIKTLKTDANMLFELIIQNNT